MSDDSVINAALANHYERRDEIIRTQGPVAARASLEMWTAILEIAQIGSWRARFHSQNEWVEYLGDLNIYGLSRANIMSKIKIQRGLTNAGATPTMAAIAAASIPSAAEQIASPQTMRQAAGKQSPDEYLQELLVLPNPGEAVARVRQDQGHTVSIWIGDIVQQGDKLLLRIIREDAGGYYNFDAVVTIQQKEGDVRGILTWLAHKLKGAR